MATAKSCRRAMVAVRNRHLGGAPLPLDDLLKEHPFIQVALVRSTYPYRASCGRWRCARCTVYLKETFLWLHTCTHGLPLQCDDLQAAGLFDAERGACRLCGAKCRASESTHACLSKLFNSAVFDLSDFFMPPGSEAADYEAWTARFRALPGIHVVIVTNADTLQGGTRGTSPLRELALPENTRYVRFHALIDTTPLDPEGRGLKAAISTAHVQEIPAVPGHPVLTDRIVCAYTGLLHSAPLKNDRDLATMAIGSGAVLGGGPDIAYINPLRVGGVAYLMNHAHPPNANCASFPWNDSIYLARLAERDVYAGDELCYDYMAITDKKKDAAIPCRCCGEPLMRYEPPPPKKIRRR